MITVFSKGNTNQVHLGQPQVEQPASIHGRWRAIDTNQTWHRLEILENYQIRLLTNTGVMFHGKIELHNDEKCTLVLLDRQNDAQQLEGTWCLWFGVLDLCFRGEYMIFSVAN